ncbi:Signal transduction histidine kinase [Filimonas lacunae]|uniref:histidine kinase n=1 Tax=Filimonas lacunae TaxID=477680 RepID=A0A173MCY1_9BACT|nr:two-component regulator propeller domain-containing protein [Filimonas lacunae]BAV05415.1 DNA-binding response regulator, AraC family [Filimonas lacunae]SIT21302.1 Signal transduction histidine kinase [Filimonas lacunae]
MKQQQYICLVAMLLSAVFCTAQQYNFKHYQVENGLSNNAVICMLQDSSHYMWMGTKDGLNRFDGYRFKVFRHNVKSNTSIGSNFIHCLQEDKRGILWIGTDKGIYRYNAILESFELLSTQITGVISEIKSDTANNLWFLMNKTLYQFQPAQYKLVWFDPERFGFFTSFTILPNGYLCLGTPEGMAKLYHPTQRTISSIDMFAHSQPVNSHWIERIYHINNNTIFIGTSNQGAKLLSLDTRTYTDILTRGNNTDLFVRNFLQVSDSTVWIASESGILVYNLRSQHFTPLQKAYNNPFSLSDNAVYSFCKDKEGGIWAGTYFGGANYCAMLDAPFQKLFPMPNQNSLSGNVVREITADAYHHIWIGTEDAGLNRLDRTTGKLTSYQPDGRKGSIAYTNIHGLLADSNRLWIGTFEHGLDVMDIPSERIVAHYSKDTETGSLQSNFIHCLTKTRQGDVLVGTTIGAYRFNRAAQQFIPLPFMPVNNWYSFIKETTDGTIWAATYGNGIRYYNPGSKQGGNITWRPGVAGSLPDNRVNSLFEDSRHRLWFATESGLCLWNSKDSSFRIYTVAEGLPADYTLSILEDGKQNIWVSTSKGLAMLSATTGQFTVYTTANGLLSDQFNFNSAYKDNNGTMYMGSVKGLMLFQPDAFTDNPYVPPVFITGIQVFNQELQIGEKNSPLQKSISYTSSIRLPYDQSTISIDFAALGFSAPEMIAYAYRMKGLEEDWVYLTKNRKAFFTRLKPGHYVFEVKAATSNGRWSHTPTSLEINILPPWWATNWAYFFYIVLSAAALVYILQLYHNYTEDKNKRKYEQLEAAKEKERFASQMEFYTNVAHEIKTPLSLIKGPLEKVMKKTGDNADIANYLGIMDRNTNRLIDLTNQLLDFRQTEINGFKLNFIQINISTLLAETFTSFRPIAEERGLRYHLQSPPNSIQAYIDTDVFKKIIYNLFSNAIKYAGKQVIVTLQPVQENDVFFTIHFQNDGFTIPEEMREKIFEPFFRIKETAGQQGSGIGLPLSRSLAQLHGGSIVVNTTASGGNVFSLQLPLHQQNETTPL